MGRIRNYRAMGNTKLMTACADLARNCGEAYDRCLASGSGEPFRDLLVATEAAVERNLFSPERRTEILTAWRQGASEDSGWDSPSSPSLDEQECASCGLVRPHESDDFRCIYCRQAVDEQAREEQSPEQPVVNPSVGELSDALSRALAERA